MCIAEPHLVGMATLICGHGAPHRRLLATDLSMGVGRLVARLTQQPYRPARPGADRRLALGSVHWTRDGRDRTPLPDKDQDRGRSVWVSAADLLAVSRSVALGHARRPLGCTDGCQATFSSVAPGDAISYGRHRRRTAPGRRLVAIAAPAVAVHRCCTAGFPLQGRQGQPEPAERFVPNADAVHSSAGIWWCRTSSTTTAVLVLGMSGRLLAMLTLPSRALRAHRGLRPR